jgi:hypothetical protein
MAIICRNYNLLFIMTPRTACTAVGELLCKHYGGQFVPAEDIFDSPGRILVEQKHSTLSQLIQYKLLTRKEVQSLLKVAAVRNPFDSLLSLYFKKRFKYQPLLSDPVSWVSRSPRYVADMKYCQTHSFNEWVLKVCSRKILKKFLGFRSSLFSDYTQGMDVILRYERIEEDLKEVFNKAGIIWKADIPTVNRTEERTDGDYRCCYSRLAAFVVGVACSYDLKTYGYQF